MLVAPSGLSLQKNSNQWVPFCRPCQHVPAVVDIIIDIHIVMTIQFCGKVSVLDNVSIIVITNIVMTLIYLWNSSGC